MDNLQQNSHKNLIIGAVVVLIIVALAAAYIYWSEANKTPEQKAEEAVETTVKEASKGALPTVQTDTTKKLPQTNPAEKTNPFGNTYSNPFE
jgi:predicted negative regulator of RcsB-dependent stress response